MIYTARFGNRHLRSGDFQAVPICLWLPRWRNKLGYPLTPTLKSLAPKQSYLRAPRETYTELYLDGLDGLGVDRVQCSFEAVSQDERPLVLLCYEDLRKPELWCHRRLFADWYLEQTGEDVPELEEEQMSML